MANGEWRCYFILFVSILYIYILIENVFSIDCNIDSFVL